MKNIFREKINILVLKIYKNFLVLKMLINLLSIINLSKFLK